MSYKHPNVCEINSIYCIQVYTWISHFSLTNKEPECSLISFFPTVLHFFPTYSDNFVIFLRFIHVLCKV